MLSRWAKQRALLFRVGYPAWIALAQFGERLGRVWIWAGQQIADDSAWRGRIGIALTAEQSYDLIDGVPVVPPREIHNGRCGELWSSKQAAQRPVEIRRRYGAAPKLVEETERGDGVSHVSWLRVRVAQIALFHFFQSGRTGQDQVSAERAVVGYLLACPEPQAAQALAKLRERDPGRVLDAEKQSTLFGPAR